MQKRWMKIALIIESALLGFILFFFMSPYFNNENVEVFRESLSNGYYTVIIWQVGDPDFPFGDAHVKVALIGGDSFRTEFQADIADDGARGSFSVVWMESGVQITLSGEEQQDAVYILPFPAELLMYA